jgi:NAD-dependent SIR2 family protein deacetylase
MPDTKSSDPANDKYMRKHGARDDWEHPATKTINDAWRSGRPIVFFLGAGLSVRTGYPSIQPLCGYLARLLFAFERDMYGMRVSDNRETSSVVADFRPSELIEQFGWPTPEQLSFDMWRWLEHIPKFQAEWSQFVADHMIFPNKEIALSISRGFLKRDFLRHIEQAVYISQLAEHDQTFAMRAASGVFRSRAIQPIRGQWVQLLDALAEGQSDLIDGLFGTLGRNRKPSIAHVYLASIIRMMGTQLILTTNFDNLVERTLVGEGMMPEVFDVFRDATVPHPTLVRNRLSVVKLHGSSFGLRIGERLQTALDETTRNRVLQYIPKNALVVVLGFGGWERRMMQLIEAWLRERNPRKTGESSSSNPKLLWLSQESTSIPYQRLQQRLRNYGDGSVNGLQKVLIQDAGTFLQSVNDRFSSNHPVSKLGYRILGPLLYPIHTDDALKSKSKGTTTSNADTTKKPQPNDRTNNIHVFCANEEFFAESNSHWDDEKMKQALDLLLEWAPSSKAKEMAVGVGSAATLSMGRFASQLEADGYSCIWIDLEEHHSVEGIVEDIFDKMRQLDPELPYLILPLNASSNCDLSTAVPVVENTRIQKACQRLFEAMRRRRYVICFDQFESIGRPQTAHHGLPQNLTEPARKNLHRRMEEVKDFILALVGLHPRQSRYSLYMPLDAYFAVAIDIPRTRHAIQQDFLESTMSNDWKLAFRLCRDFYRLATHHRDHGNRMSSFVVQ